MNTKLQRPNMKLADTKVSERDMIYFSLGLSAEDYVLPSERADYRSDARAVRLIQDIRAGKDLSGQDFSGINLKNADISGGRFAGSSFKGAILYKTTACACDFQGCDFTEAYLEQTDLSHSDLTGADFAQTYLRNLTTDGAETDADFDNRLAVLAVLIAGIESGKIDIHCLTRPELMCLDLRRLDMSHVDISGMDLSMFNLEGVNLRGVYINPLQKLSMNQWQKDLALVEKMQEKKLKEETLKTLKARHTELNTYAKGQTEVIPPKTKGGTRPHPKQDEFARPSAPQAPKTSDDKPDTDTRPESVPNTLPPHKKILGQMTRWAPRTKKNKNRS